MRINEMIRVLIANGCYIIRNGANHDLWFSPITKRMFPVARHGSKEMPIGTLKEIEKLSGIKF